MAMIERDVVLVGKDANGNTTVDMPITRLGNLEDTAETKTAPVSGDALAIVDSEADGEVKKISWADILAAVKDAVGGGDGEALEALKQALAEHEEDPDKHIAADERAAWNHAKENSDAHAADDTRHVTDEEREKWNSAGGGDGAKVGDILYSSRRDLGDKWALCNGDLVDPEEYAELDAVLPMEGQHMDAEHTLVGAGAPARIAYRDGYWVGIANTAAGQVLRYASHPNGPWHDTKLGSDLLDQTTYEWSLPEKIGPCWVMQCHQNKSNFNENLQYRRIVSTLGSLIDGEWSINPSELGSSGYYLGPLQYGNGGWACVQYYASKNYNYVLTCKEDTPCGSWSAGMMKTIALNGYANGSAVAYDQEREKWCWIAISNPSDPAIYITTADALGGGWGEYRKLKLSEGEACVVTSMEGKAIFLDYELSRIVKIPLSILIDATNGDVIDVQDERVKIVDLPENIVLYDRNNYLCERRGDNGESTLCMLVRTKNEKTYANVLLEENEEETGYSVVGKNEFLFGGEKRVGDVIGIGGTNQYYNTKKCLPTLESELGYAYIRVKEG